MNTETTRERLMLAAERIIRSRGYSAFSYADLSEAVGLRKASIHHHFPAKADLGVALVEDYIARFREMLTDITDAEQTAHGRLARYGGIYEAGLREGMLCLCGMLAAEATVLPEQVRHRMGTFFAAQLDWLEEVLAQGHTAREVTLRGPARRAAEHVLSTLQGASLVGWGTGNPDLVARAVEDLLASLRS
ncbi:TetR/AcrR family transcriptional regulator [Falsiroseomonas sp. HC035]|uniref:TetR/AcrR family transcriptional regulator n=1 Tax=Falsiroseomonas sp. HC035 TaxID=3390999 RepID=UPI003D320622